MTNVERSSNSRTLGMVRVGWALVLLLICLSAIFPTSVGAFSTPSAILLAMVLLAVAERRKLAAHLKPGEKVTMPKSQKIVLAIFVGLLIALMFIGGLTRQ